jgi:hypothetical protein
VINLNFLRHLYSLEQYYPAFEAQWAAEGKVLPGYVQREFED